jgi:hypothetical protein
VLAQIAGTLRSKVRTSGEVMRDDVTNERAQFGFSHARTKSS